MRFCWYQTLKTRGRGQWAKIQDLMTKLNHADGDAQYAFLMRFIGVIIATSGVIFLMKAPSSGVSTAVSWAIIGFGVSTWFTQPLRRLATHRLYRSRAARMRRYWERHAQPVTEEPSVDTFTLIHGGMR